MRDLEGRRRGPRQRIAGHGLAVENAVTFGRERPPFDAIEMQHRGMRSEARPDRRARVDLGPIDQLGEVAPIRFLVELGRNRLGAGHDQAIELVAPESVSSEYSLSTCHFASGERFTEGSEKQ